jgi:hypothetical protein
MRAEGFPVTTPTVFVDAASTGGTPVAVSARYEMSDPPPITPLMKPVRIPARERTTKFRSESSNTI